MAEIKAQGATLIEVDLSKIATASFEVGFPVGFFEMKTALDTFLSRHQPGTGLAAVVDAIASPDVEAVYRHAVLGAGAPSDADYAAAIARIPAIRADHLMILDNLALDAILYPTAPLEAQSIANGAQSVMLNGQEIPTMQAFMRNLAATGVYGAPGLSLPLPLSGEALPVGLALDGRPEGDRALLAVGGAIEEALSPMVWPQS